MVRGRRGRRGRRGQGRRGQALRTGGRRGQALFWANRNEKATWLVTMDQPTCVRSGLDQGARAARAERRHSSLARLMQEPRVDGR